MLRKADEGLHHSREQVQAALLSAQELAELAGYETPANAALVAALTSHFLSKQVMFEHVDGAGVLLNRHGPQG